MFQIRKDVLIWLKLAWSYLSSGVGTHVIDEAFHSANTALRLSQLG